MARWASGDQRGGDPPTAARSAGPPAGSVQQRRARDYPMSKHAPRSRRRVNLNPRQSHRRMRSDIVHSESMGMSRQDIIREVSAENVRRHVEHVTTNVPSRLAGSPNARRMAEYSSQMLREAGADARIQELPGLVSFPKKAELRVVAPREIAIEANTLGHSVPTLPDGIAGELMDVASGGFADYEGRDATGKIMLSELSYSPARHEKQRVAGLMGAIGCVMMNWGHPRNTAVPFGSVKPAWGNPTPDAFKTEMPTLPCIGIARTAGLQLREMLKNGPVRVWFRANVENGWRPVQITLGEFKSARSEEFVL